MDPNDPFACSVIATVRSLRSRYPYALRQCFPSNDAALAWAEHWLEQYSHLEADYEDADETQITMDLAFGNYFGPVRRGHPCYPDDDPDYQETIQ